MKVTLKLNSLHPKKYVLDSRKYRGKGRPRKLDYTEMFEYIAYKHRLHNTLLNECIDRALFNVQKDV